MKFKLLVIFVLLYGLSLNLSWAAAAGPRLAYRDQAVRAIQAQDLKQAMAVLDKGLAAYPNDQTLHYLRGTLYLQLKHPQKALDDLEQTARLGGQWAHLRHKIAIARLQLGKEAFVKGDNQTAIVQLQLALSDIPEEFKPLTAYWLSMALQRQNEDEQAASVLASTLEQFPNASIRPVLRHHLDKLSQEQKPRSWWMNLQLGIAHDETVGLYPEPYVSPLWPNDKDTRGQLDIGSYWRLRHSDTSSTTLSYRLFAGDYVKLKDYNTIQQDFGVDHRIRTQHGNWGMNLQVVAADLAIEGKQNNVIANLYRTNIPNPRRMSISKLMLFHNKYSLSTYQQYDGDGIGGLYRYYFLQAGRNDRTYIGGQLRYYEAANPLYTHSTYGIDLGFERSFYRLDYGIQMSLEHYDYTNRPNLQLDEHQVHKLYVAYNFSDNLSLEWGILHKEGDSRYINSHYSRALGYLVMRWQP